MMLETKEIAKRIGSLCKGVWTRNYTQSKLKTDPLYGGVFEELKGRKLPLLDVGCGMGILAMYLRERGCEMPIHGFDYDARKIADGEFMVEKGGYEEMTLSQGDARSELPEQEGDVTILDILQFFEEDEQRVLLEEAAKRVGPGGKLVIRSGLRERNLRFFVTWVGDVFAKASFWMKAAPVHYPTAEFMREVLEGEGFEVEVRPFWGKTPFNNYLIVGSRRESI